MRHNCCGNQAEYNLLYKDSFIDLLNQEIEEMQRSMEKNEQERNDNAIK